MFSRCLKLPKNKSFFLFGARSTGKSTFLKTNFSEKTTVFIDLLLPSIEERFARHPDDLIAEVKSLPPHINLLVLDEVQKVPKLLDVVHHIIEEKKFPIRFALTGSSGRKLKKGSANLLAGRAHVCELFPLTVFEMGDSFNLEQVLTWGGLPEIFSLEEDEKHSYLSSYVRTYISEEIQKEQIVRNLDPFRYFLELAAQYNGKIINYSNLAKGIGVDPKTIANYYQILEDTLVGHFLLPFDYSFRKKLIKSPKFYFFDQGVCRAIARLLTIPCLPSTSYYGEVFEHFIFCQLKHEIEYLKNDFKLSYYLDENGIEVDFVIERPGKKILFLEIKSSVVVQNNMVSNLNTVAKDFPDAEFQLWSNDERLKTYGKIKCLPWMQGLRELLKL